jgi:PIN domain nuclease of toxin-antitoxin system
MRLLLDTHALLWWTLTPERLSEKTRNLLADSNNDWLIATMNYY